MWAWWHYEMAWWRYQMETFSALLAFWAGNSLVTGEFPSQRPVMRIFDVFFDLRLDKWLSKQSKHWWFKTPSCSLWHQCNGIRQFESIKTKYQMETFSALLAFCAGNSLVTGEFPSQRPGMLIFDVFFDLRLDKRLSKQSKRWWFKTPSCSLWHQCNGIREFEFIINKYTYE